MFDKIEKTISLLADTHQVEQLSCLMDDVMWEEMKTQITAPANQICTGIHGVSVYCCSMPRSLKNEVIFGSESEIKLLIDIIEGRSTVLYKDAVKMMEGLT